MNFAFTDTKETITGTNTTSWLGIVAAVLLAGVLFMAYCLQQDGAAELQTAPLQTLLFIDNSTKNL